MQRNYGKRAFQDVCSDYLNLLISILLSGVTSHFVIDKSLNGICVMNRMFGGEAKLDST